MHSVYACVCLSLVWKIDFTGVSQPIGSAGIIPRFPPLRPPSPLWRRDLAADAIVWCAHQPKPVGFKASIYVSMDSVLYREDQNERRKRE